MTLPSTAKVKVPLTKAFAPGWFPATALWPIRSIREWMSQGMTLKSSANKKKVHSAHLQLFLRDAAQWCRQRKEPKHPPKSAETLFPLDEDIIRANYTPDVLVNEHKRSAAVAEVRKVELQRWLRLGKKIWLGCFLLFLTVFKLWGDCETEIDISVAFYSFFCHVSRHTPAHISTFDPPVFREAFGPFLHLPQLQYSKRK